MSLRLSILGGLTPNRSDTPEDLSMAALRFCNSRHFRHFRHPRTSRLLPVAAALVLAACSEGGAQAPGAGAPPPPPVGVLAVKVQPVALQQELPGRVEARRTAQVRARVTGIVVARQFSEGSEVKAGQPLFRIDPAPYEAALASAQAQQQRAEAAAAQARLTAERYAPLAQVQAISAQDYAAAVAVQKTAEADVAAAKAAVQSARLNLGYAQVAAPIGGRIGRALVTEGALVSAAEATPLALVQQIDRVYVNFTQSANELQSLQRALAAGSLQRSDAVAVQVLLDDGSLLPQTGKLLFSDLAVDASSGQVTLRAEVPNPQGLLLPGQFVRVRFAPATLPQAMLLPQQAVTRTQQGDSVLVVGEGMRPAQRRITVAGAQDGQWIVTGGLQPGEQVIVDGFQKMFVPGAPVTPVPWTPAATAASAAASR